MKWFRILLARPKLNHSSSLPSSPTAPTPYLCANPYSPRNFLSLGSRPTGFFTVMLMLLQEDRPPCSPLPLHCPTAHAQPLLTPLRLPELLLFSPQLPAEIPSSPPPVAFFVRCKCLTWCPAPCTESSGTFLSDSHLASPFPFFSILRHVIHSKEHS